MLEVVGLGLILPYVTLILEPNAIKEYTYLIEVFKLPRDQKNLLIVLGLTLIGVFLIKAVLAIYINWLTTLFSLRQMQRLRKLLMQSYQSLPYTEYISRNSSEYVHSIQNLTGQLSSVVSSFLKSISDGLIGLAIFLVLAWTNVFVFSILMSLLVLVIFGYDKLFRKKLKEYGVKINKANTSMLQGINEGMEGFKEIRVLGHETYFQMKVNCSAQQVTTNQSRQNAISTAPRYLMEFILVCFIVLLVIILQEINYDVITIVPILSVFGVAALRLLPIANVFSSNLVNLRFTRNSINLLYKDLKNIKQTEEKIDNETKNSSKIKKTNNNIENPTWTQDINLELNELCFRYPSTNHDSLKNITFKICLGDSVGFVGASGAGKTTLIDVILGLLEPYKGKIEFNGMPMRQNISNWLKQVAYLPQQVFLIDNTLRRNIALGVEDNAIDETKLHESLCRARIIEMSAKMPLGLDTIIGERGVRLSGGQRQRVALARAFYHGRNVLVMDEATSALDNETELEIVEEIKHLKGKITMIVIAHRLTTVQHCDRIYRIDDGQIIDSGTYDQVVK